MAQAPIITILKKAGELLRSDGLVYDAWKNNKRLQALVGPALLQLEATFIRQSQLALDQLKSTTRESPLHKHTSVPPDVYALLGQLYVGLNPHAIHILERFRETHVTTILEKDPTDWTRRDVASMAKNKAIRADNRLRSYFSSLTVYLTRRYNSNISTVIQRIDTLMDKLAADIEANLEHEKILPELKTRSGARAGAERLDWEDIVRQLVIQLVPRLNELPSVTELSTTKQFTNDDLYTRGPNKTIDADKLILIKNELERAAGQGLGNRLRRLVSRTKVTAEQQQKAEATLAKLATLFSYLPLAPNPGERKEFVQVGRESLSAFIKKLQTTSIILGKYFGEGKEKIPGLVDALRIFLADMPTAQATLLTQTETLLKDLGARLEAAAPIPPQLHAAEKYSLESLKEVKDLEQELKDMDPSETPTLNDDFLKRGKEFEWIQDRLPTLLKNLNSAKATVRLIGYSDRRLRRTEGIDQQTVLKLAAAAIAIASSIEMVILRLGESDEALKRIKQTSDPNIAGLHLRTYTHEIREVRSTLKTIESQLAVLLDNHMHLDKAFKTEEEEKEEISAPA